MAPRDEADRERSRGDRMIFNFLADRRLRFAVHTIGLIVGIVLMVMFELPPLFGFAFIAWWVAWTLQRDVADIYREIYEINDRIAQASERGGAASAPAHGGKARS